MNEITEANFVNLANNLIGTGLINTGKVNFELAKDYAEQEAINFAEWISNHPQDFETGGNGQFVGLNCKYVSSQSLYQEYQQSKQSK